jgi:hypothetical protein
MTGVDSQRRLLAKNQLEAVSLADLETRWSARRSDWVRKLGRLRLGVEPIEEQLSRYRRVTWMLTAIPGFLSAVLFTLFTVFGRPGIGVVVAALFFVPIASGAWVGDFLRERRGRRYLVELENYHSARERLQAKGAQ